MSKPKEIVLYLTSLILPSFLIIYVALMDFSTNILLVGLTLIVIGGVYIRITPDISHGIIEIEETEEGAKMYSLTLFTHPDSLDEKTSVIFQVVPKQHK